ncbi:MAG: hypothetical protein HQL06_12195 [Nitrospirae bacterium]|nr:hypothetical protein [Nitrospirota bacterium]
MLKKIIAIKNVGRFRSSAIGGDTTFAKHSFIIGANGFGKTTICAILRLLKDGDATHVIGRKTLGVSEVPTIELLTTSGKIKFNGTAWNSGYSDLAIFDGVFISENVYSGDVVDTDQKRNLYRVIVGVAGVSLAEQETKLVGEIRTKTTEIGTIAKAIQSHIPQDMKLETFIALPKTDSISELIIAQESLLTTIREAAGIKTRATLVEIVLPDLPSGFTELLAKTIDDINKAAERRINTHFIDHGLTNGGGWIVQGIDHAGDSCPFCGQDIKGLPLIAAYKLVFIDSYKALRAAITAIKATIGQVFGDTSLAKLDTVAEQHKGGVEFWSKYCQLDTVALTYPASVADAIKAMNAAAMALIERKTQELLEGYSC